VLTRALRLLPPETAHRLALWGLGHGLAPRARLPDYPRLRSQVLGHDFAHPLGLAAGFDKNAEAIGGLLGLGFSFVEIGTVTPRPQAGNPRPRLFRLPEDAALINRLGFNNEGLEAVRARLARRQPGAGIVGANLGINRDAADPQTDYEAGLRGLYALVDYVTVNVSSPNTPGLRALQGRDALRALLGRLLAVRAELAAGGRPKPLLVKIAPDLSAAEEEALVAVVLEQGADGLIVSNTTLARPATLQSRHREETGGLSGRPLLAPSTAQLRRLYRLTGGRLPLIGVGGIASGQDAYDKIKAGASLLQLYTALVYQGPGLVARILGELDALLARDGHARLRDAIGQAAGPLPG
jgi:dihydroorotate dehydrogenase